ncbi:MAG: MotA/TolQ/ExbB proton channel family protein [Candidatus Omnitrophica bacterium]|nr:MotA/TolQ/ExbB proton channel family protein [Candidatus Omnitrophota bacterium]
MWQFISTNAQFLIKGGWVMLPILLCSIFSLTIIIERFIFFATVSSNKLKVVFKIFELARKNRISDAVNMCEKNPFYITNILKAGLLHYEESKDFIKEAMENVSLYEIPRLEKNLNFLSTIAHISPLLGLLGTVTGLVRCFYAIEKKAALAGLVNPSDLAGGIWEALITTVAGLCVAIPTYIAYNYFVHRVNLSILETERAATELLEILSQQRYLKNTDES